MLKCAAATPLMLISIVPPLPAEWKYVMILLIALLKPVSNPPPLQTLDTACPQINRPKCQFKSSSRMNVRNSRTR